jgi:PAS domain S-box-containing protein
VQQAAYTLIPLEDKQKTHLKIGKLLLNSSADEQNIKDIFFLVNQLNQGRNLIESQAEKYQLARLNFQAGKKAKQSSAWLAAGEYFKIALSLLDISSWQTDYDLTFNLYLSSAEIEFLNTRIAAAESLLELIVSKTNILLDQVKAYELNVQIFTAKNQFIEAIELGLQTLEKLDIILIQPTPENLNIQLPSLEELEKFPEMTAAKPLAAMSILELISAAAYFAKPEIFLQLSLTMVRLSLDYGNSLQSASGYIKYAIFLCGIKGDIEAGYHAGKLALNLTQRQPMSASRCRVDLIFNLFICAWKEPVKEAILGFQTTLQNSLSVGDLEDAASSAGNSCIYRFFAGEKLDQLVQEQGTLLEFLDKNQQGSFVYFARIWRQLSQNLLGEVDNIHNLSGDSFQENTMLADLLQANNHSALLCIYTAQGILSYLLGDFAQALSATQAAEKYVGAGTAWLVLAIHKFYQALILLANYQPEYLATIEANQEQIKLWAIHAPSNFHHKYELITAEKYRVLGNKIEAIDAFERAINTAKENNYLPEEALANELLAQLYLDWGKEKIAQIYLQEAHSCYQNWSAKAKIKILENKYSNLLKLSLQNPSQPTTLNHSLDLATVIKAAEIINSQVYLNQLIAKLMEIVIENTGADKGVLILAEKRGLEIVAITTRNKEIFFCSRLIEDSSDVPSNIIRYTANAKSPIIVNDIEQELFNQNEPYFLNHQLASALSIPLLKQGKILGIVYLENQRTKYAFSEQRIEILQLICSQAAISLENARLYQQLQSYSQSLEATINERTKALEQEMEQRELTLKALRNSEQRYRLIVETAEEGIWMIDTENKTSFVNPKMAQILGYTSEEMLGLPLFNFMDEEGIALANYHIKRRQQGISEQHDFKFQHRDGNDVWTLISTNPMFSDEGEYLGSLAMITDITERRSNEEAIRVSQQQMAAITANLPGAVFRFIYNADGSYSCPFASEGYLRLFGFNPEELRANPSLMLDWVHHEDRQKYLEAAAKAKTENIESFYSEVRFILPTGEEKWVATIAQLFRDIDGNVFVDGIDLDISEQKEAEFALQRLNEQLEQRVEQRTQELQNQAQLLETILQNMGDGVLVCDCDGEIILMNSVAEKFAGQNLPKTGIENWSNFWGICFPDGTPCPTEQLPVVRGLRGESIDSSEVIVYSPSYPDGLYLEVNVRPLKDESGTILGAVAVSRDISDRKQVEAMLRQTNLELEKRVESRTFELQEAKDKAEAANQAKSTFLAHMSHELRTPLNAILGFSQLLSRQDGLNSSQREQLNIINRSGEHLLALINDILQFSKIEAGYVNFQPTVFNLPDLLRTLEQMFALKATSKGLTLECHCCDHLSQYISTDQGKLRQILINILGNAIKFTDRGGINMRFCQENRENQTYLEIQITDTGIGITPEALEKVFAPFLQVHAPSPNREGTGLGLAISRQFVEMMGGNIAINSVIGQGTSVSINIPIKIDSLPQLSPLNNSQPPKTLAPNQPDWRILVAEDQEDSRLFLTEMLTQIGFQVRCANNGQAAVQLWQEWQPHLIWMDMRMPILDGLEATGQIRSQEQEKNLTPCKIIALTAHAFEEEKSQFLAMGCDDFLSKPVTETSLVEKLSQHLQVIYLETELPEISVSFSAQLTSEDLKIMSPKWLDSFYQAVLSIDSALILSLLEQIPPESKQLSDSIRFYVQEFDFDKLLAVTKQAIN